MLGLHETPIARDTGTRLKVFKYLDSLRNMGIIRVHNSSSEVELISCFSLNMLMFSYDGKGR